MPKVTELRPTAPPLTLGASRARLEANGYAPCSALWPYGVAMDVHPALVAHPPAWMIAEHPAAILTHSRERRHVAALVISDALFGDDELAARARKVLESRGLLSGPRRIATDGSVLHPVRYGAYAPIERCEALGGAVAASIGWRAGPGAPFFGLVVPLAGDWQGGDLLSIPYDSLPELTEPEALTRELDHLTAVLAEERRPAPRPSRKAWLA